MQRPNLKILPSEGEHRTRIAVIDDRLALPKAEAAALRCFALQSILALATDQAEYTRLVFGQLMREADGLHRRCWYYVGNGTHDWQSFGSG